MNTDALKISLAQRILSLSDNKLLEKISGLLDVEHIIGYNADGTPVTDIEYREDITSALHQLNEDTMETYTSDDVKKRILGK